MRNASAQPRPPFWRVLAAFLCLSLTLPVPAHALRPQLDRSGLEERLKPVRSELVEERNSPAVGREEDAEVQKLVKLVSAIVPARIQPVFGEPGKHRLGQFLSFEEGRRLRTFISLERALQEKERQQLAAPEEERAPPQKVDTQRTKKILTQLRSRAKRAFSEQGPQGAEDLPLFSRHLIRLSGTSSNASVFYPGVQEKELADFAWLYLDRKSGRISPEIRRLLYGRMRQRVSRNVRWPWIQGMARWYFQDRFPDRAAQALREDSSELPDKVVDQAFDDIEAAIRNLRDYQKILRTPQPSVDLSAKMGVGRGWVGSPPARPRSSVPSRRGLPAGQKSRTEIANKWVEVSGALVRALIRTAPAGEDSLIGQGTRIQFKLQGRWATKKIPAWQLIKWVENPVGNWHGFRVEKVDWDKGTIGLVGAYARPSGSEAGASTSIALLPGISENLISLAADKAFLAGLWEPLESTGPSTELRTGLEEDEEDTPGVSVFQGRHFTASEWIPFLSGYLQQAVREKKMPLQVQLSGPKGGEEIPLPLPGGMTDPSERGARSRDWDPDTLRSAFRRIGIDPENNQEYWTVTLDEMAGEFHFRFAPHEAGSSSSKDLTISVSDDLGVGGPDEAENQAPEEWGLFPWGNGQEPNWLVGQGGASWGAAELLYEGSLRTLAAWLEQQSISDWKESKGISRIEIVFPANPLKIRREIHNLDGPNDMNIHWIAKRILKEVGPIAGWDAPYEAVWVEDRVEIRPAPSSSESAAGLEENAEFYQQLLDQPRVHDSIEEAIASIGRVEVGDHWMVVRSQPEGPSLKLLDLHILSPTSGMLQWGQRTYPVRFPIRSPSVRLEQDVLVEVRQGKYELLGNFLRQNGIPLGEVALDWDPLDTAPTGWVYRDPDKGGTAHYRSSDMHLLILDSSGRLQAVHSAASDHRIKPLHEQWIRPLLTYNVKGRLHRGANLPPFLSLPSLQVRTETAHLPPHVVFNAAGEGKIYILRQDEPAFQSLEGEMPQLAEWYQQQILTPLDQGQDIQGALQEWDNRLARFFTIAPIQGFRRPEFEDLEYWFKLGVESMQSGSLLQAIQAFQQVLRIQPDQVSALINVGTLLIMVEQPSQAMEVLQRATQMAPKNSDAWHMLGSAYQVAYRLDEAAPAFLKAIELDPNGTNSKTSLGAVYSAQGKSAEAIALLTESTRENPHPESFHNLGVAYFESHRYAQAIESFWQALRRTPRLDPSTLSYLGDSYFALGKYEQAMGAYEQALRVVDQPLPRAWSGLTRSAIALAKEQYPLAPELPLSKYLERVQAFHEAWSLLLRRLERLPRVSPELEELDPSTGFSVSDFSRLLFNESLSKEEFVQRYLEDEVLAFTRLLMLGDVIVGAYRTGSEKGIVARSVRQIREQLIWETGFSSEYFVAAAERTLNFLAQSAGLEEGDEPGATALFDGQAVAGADLPVRLANALLGMGSARGGDVEIHLDGPDGSAEIHFLYPNPETQRRLDWVVRNVADFARQIRAALQEIGVDPEDSAQRWRVAASAPDEETVRLKVIRAEPAAGLEEPLGPSVSRRDFLKLGGAGVAQSTLGAETAVVGEISADAFAKIGQLVDLYKKWPMYQLPWDTVYQPSSSGMTSEKTLFPKPEEFIRKRAEAQAVIQTLKEDHFLRKQFAATEQAFRAVLLELRAADPAVSPGVAQRAEGLLVALDRPEQFPLWAMTRTLPWLLREEFQVRSLDPDRELQRAVRARMSPEQYLADLAAQYVAPDHRFLEMVRFLQERGVPENPSDLQQISQDQLELVHRQLMANGMRLTTDSLEFYQPTTFLRREQREIIEHVWGEKSHSLFERLKARFGPDFQNADIRIWPDPSNDVTLEQVLREKEERSVSASLAARRGRLSQRLDDLLQQRPRGSVSKEVIHQEKTKIRELPDNLLEQLDLDRYLAEAEQRHPAPPPADLEEQIRRAVAVKRLPAPADPVLELARKLADSAQGEPAVLFIQRGFDNVSLRWRAGAQGERSRLNRWERDSLKNAGWFSLVQHKRYMVGIDPGISAKEVLQHLRRGGFLWQQAPDEDGIVRWDIQRKRVIALPGPAEPAAGGSAPLTTGLEEPLGPNVSRRDFLRIGGGAGALLPGQEKPDTLLPTVPPGVFGRIAKLVRLYRRGLPKPEELIQGRVAVAKDIGSLGQDHFLRRQLAEAENVFRGKLNRSQTADAGTAPDLLLRKEGLLVALDRPEQYPLWAMTRTLPWLLREEFQVRGLDPDRELQRAVGARMSPEIYLADLAARYVAKDGRFLELIQFLNERDAPTDPQWLAQYQLKEVHEQLMDAGMRLTTDSLRFSRPADFLYKVGNEKIERVWKEKLRSLVERLEARFGPDFQDAWTQIWPDRSNDVTLEQVLRKNEEGSVKASLAARKSRLSQRVDHLLRERSRESISEEEIHQEERRISELPDDALERLDFDRYLAEVEQRHPVPPPADFAERMSQEYAVKRLPAPADPVLELAKKLADSAQDESAVLFIRKGLDNVSLRWRAGAKGEWSRLNGWERDSLRNSDWLALVRRKQYVVGIDPGISAEEIHRHLRRGGFLWQQVPDEDGIVRWDIQRKRVIALPGPAEPAAVGSTPPAAGGSASLTTGPSAGLRTGLEEPAMQGGQATMLEKRAERILSGQDPLSPFMWKEQANQLNLQQTWSSQKRAVDKKRLQRVASAIRTLEGRQEGYRAGERQPEHLPLLVRSIVRFVSSNGRDRILTRWPTLRGEHLRAVAESPWWDLGKKEFQAGQVKQLRLAYEKRLNAKQKSQFLHQLQLYVLAAVSPNGEVSMASTAPVSPPPHKTEVLPNWIRWSGPGLQASALTDELFGAALRDIQEAIRQLPDYGSLRSESDSRTPSPVKRDPEEQIRRWHEMSLGVLKILITSAPNGEEERIGNRTLIRVWDTLPDSENRVVNHNSPTLADVRRRLERSNQSVLVFSHRKYKQGHGLGWVIRRVTTQEGQPGYLNQAQITTLIGHLEQASRQSDWSAFFPSIVSAQTPETEDSIPPMNRLELLQYWREKSIALVEEMVTRSSLRENHPLDGSQKIVVSDRPGVFAGRMLPASRKTLGQLLNRLKVRNLRIEGLSIFQKGPSVRLQIVAEVIGRTHPSTQKLAEYLRAIERFQEEIAGLPGFEQHPVRQLTTGPAADTWRAGLEEGPLLIQPGSDDYSETFGLGPYQFEEKGLPVLARKLEEKSGAVIRVTVSAPKEAAEWEAWGLKPLADPVEFWKNEIPHKNGQKVHIETVVDREFLVIPLTQPIEVAPGMTISAVRLTAKEPQFIHNPNLSKGFETVLKQLQGKEKKVGFFGEGGFSVQAIGLLLQKGRLFLVSMPWGLPSTPERNLFEEMVHLTGTLLPTGRLMSEDELRQAVAKNRAASAQQVQATVLSQVEPDVAQIRENLTHLLEQRVRSMVKPNTTLQAELAANLQQLSAERWVNASGVAEKGVEAVRRFLREQEAALRDRIAKLPERAGPLAEHVSQVSQALVDQAWDRFLSLQQAIEKIRSSPDRNLPQEEALKSSVLKRLAEMIQSVEEVLRKGEPEALEQRDKMRFWQTEALAFLAVTRSLSEAQAHEFLAYVRPLEGLLWVGLLDPWGRTAPMDGIFSGSAAAWPRAIVGLSFLVEPDRFDMESRERAELTERMVLSMLRGDVQEAAQASSEEMETFTLSHIRRKVREVRREWGYPPEPLRVDLLLHRDAAAWNLAGVFNRLAAEVARDQGWVYTAEQLVRHSDNAYAESERLAGRPPWRPESTLHPARSPEADEKELVDFLGILKKTVQNWNQLASIDFPEESFKPPALYRWMRRHDPDLHPETVVLLDQLVRLISEKFKTDPPPMEVIQRYFRLVQVSLVRYLMSTTQMPAPTARLFLEDPGALQREVWEEQLAKPVEAEAEWPERMVSVYFLLALTTPAGQLDSETDVQKRFAGHGDGFYSGYVPMGAQENRLSSIMRQKPFSERFAKLLRTKVGEVPMEQKIGMLTGRPAVISNLSLILAEVIAQVSDSPEYRKQVGDRDERRQSYLQQLKKNFPDYKPWFPEKLFAAGGSAPLSTGLEEGDRETADYWIDLGKKFEQQENPHLAVWAYQNASVADPTYAVPHLQLGTLHFGRQQLDQAIPRYQKATELDPQDAQAWGNLGAALLGMQRIEEAAGALQKALELDPQYVWPLSNLGLLYVQQGRVTEAISLLERAVRLDQKMPAPRVNLGIAYEKAGRLADAMEAYEQAIGMYPRAHPELWMDLARVRDATGDFSGASQAYRQALEIDSEFPGAWSGLTRALRDQALSPDQGKMDATLVLKLQQAADLHSAWKMLWDQVWQRDRSLPDLFSLESDAGEALKPRQFNLLDFEYLIFGERFPVERFGDRYSKDPHADKRFQLIGAIAVAILKTWRTNGRLVRSEDAVLFNLDLMDEVHISRELPNKDLRATVGRVLDLLLGPAAGLEEDAEVRELVRLVLVIVPAGIQPAVGEPGKHRLGQFLLSEEGRKLRTFIGLARALQRKERQRLAAPEEERAPRQEVDTRDAKEILARLESRADRAFSTQGPQSVEDLPLLSRHLIYLSGASPNASVSYPGVREKDLADFAHRYLDRKDRRISPENRRLLYGRVKQRVSRKGRWPWVREMALWYFQDRFPGKAVQAPREDSSKLPDEVVDQAFDDIEAAIRNLRNYQKILRVPQPPVDLSATVGVSGWVGSPLARPGSSVSSRRKVSPAADGKSRNQIANEWVEASGALARALIQAAPAGEGSLIGPGTRSQFKLRVQGKWAPRKIPVRQLRKWVEDSPGNWRGFLMEGVDRNEGMMGLVGTYARPSGGTAGSPMNIALLPKISKNLTSLAADKEFLARLWEPLESAGGSAPLTTGLEEGRNSEGLGETTRSNDEDDAFGTDQWRKGLLPEGKPTKLLPEQTTSSHSPFLVGASRQASDTQITMPATNTALNSTESFPKISPANAPANRILAKSASVFDRTSRLPSVSIGFPTVSNIPRSSGAIHAAGGSAPLTTGMEEDEPVSIKREFDLDPQMHLNPVQHVWQVVNEIETRFSGVRFEFSLRQEDQWQVIGRTSFIDFLGQENRWDNGRRIQVIVQSRNPLLQSGDLEFFVGTIVYILTSQDGISREKESMDFRGQVQNRLGVRYDQISGRTAAITPISAATAGLEEGRGFVLVEGVGLVAPRDLPENFYYAVAVGLEQAAALIAAGRAPGRIITVAIGLGEVSGLAALGIPGDQIIPAWEWPTLEAAKNYAVRLGREWLAGLGGLQVSVLEVTARSLQGILAQFREMLPSGWQLKRPVTAQDAERALDLAA